MKVKKENKFKLIWNKIKKPLMIISIIGNIIFILSLFIGCSNLKNKKVESVSAEDTPITSLAGKTLVFPQTINPVGTMPSIRTSDTLLTFVSNETTYYGLENGGTSANGYTSSLQYFTNASNLNNISKQYVYQVSQSGWLNDNYKTIIIDENTPNATNSTTIALLQYLGATEYVEPVDPEEPTEVTEYLDTIYLNDNFIPTSYVAQNGDYIFNGFAGKNTSADTHPLLLNGFTFESNKTLFNQIRFIYAPLNAVASYVTQDGTTLVDVSSYNTYMACVAIKYEYVQNSNILYTYTVASPRRKIIVQDSLNYNVFDVRAPFNVWLNDAYRTINVIEDTQTIISDSFLQFSNKSAVELLHVTTNVSQDVMGATNVFNLLTGAFTGMVALLGISVLPNITLGLLMFLPLIVLVIITIIRMIKK